MARDATGHLEEIQSASLLVTTTDRLPLSLFIKMNSQVIGDGPTQSCEMLYTSDALSGLMGMCLRIRGIAEAYLGKGCSV